MKVTAEAQTISIAKAAFLRREIQRISQSLTFASPLAKAYLRACPKLFQIQSLLKEL